MTNKQTPKYFPSNFSDLPRQAPRRPKGSPPSGSIAKLNGSCLVARSASEAPETSSKEPTAKPKARGRRHNPYTNQPLGNNHNNSIQ